MGKVDVPYYVVRNGAGYFQPGKAMREAGFAPRPLGPDGPEAWSRARALYADWLRHRAGAEEKVPAAAATPATVEAAIVYPKGSIGEAFQRYLRTPEWAAKAPGTRNKIWLPAWRRFIRPAFGDCRPDTLTLEDMSAWRVEVATKYGNDAAHKAVKVWRAFWKVLQGLHYATTADPSTGIRNVQPKPRSERWREGEIVRIVKEAWRREYYGLAALVAVIWDTSFQPGDARTLRSRHLFLDAAGRMVFDRTQEGREKTGAPALGTVSRRAAWLVAEYLDRRGLKLTDDAFLFANRSGNPYSVFTACDDFARVRDLVFPGDRRQMRDMRRSGASEAVSGVVDRNALAAKLANSIHASDRLWKTYVRIDASAVRDADAARLRGRARLRAEPPQAEVADLSKARRRRAK